MQSGAGFGSLVKAGTLEVVAPPQLWLAMWHHHMVTQLAAAYPPALTKQARTILRSMKLRITCC